MKTTRYVEPAETNGSGTLVSGILSDITRYCTKKSKYTCSFTFYNSLPHFLQNLSLCEFMVLHCGHSFFTWKPHFEQNISSS